MRIRRKAWARPELENCKFYINSPELFIGKWNNVFDKLNPIHVEFGCGKGDFISNMSCYNKNINYIAVDIKSEMLAITKRKIENIHAENNLEIDNVKIFSFDISRINLIFNNCDKIEKIYINFCNPWPKLRHMKKRLTHTRQLLQYKEFLISGGQILFKTDDDNLFNDSIKYFEQEDFIINYITEDLHNSEFNKENIITEHERMFSSQGIKIKFILATKK